MTRVVLAGGGSAGHTSPLIATAGWLRRIEPDIEITAVGSPRGLETRVIPAAGLTLELVPPVPLPRRPTPDLLRVPGRVRGAVRVARTIIHRAQADVVVGFGGYVSLPVYLAARLEKVPLVVHEGNLLPGLANKVGARFTRHVATSYVDTPLPHARFVGLPLRSEIEQFDRAALRPAALAAFDLADDRPTLLVSGGSQGARSINAAVYGSRFRLLAAGIQILHVLGPKNLTADHHASDDATTGGRYRPVAYVDRMEQAYAVADLMLARAGSNTVIETAVTGLPCVFVPLPHGNGEQARNAGPVIDAGGGLLVDDADCTADDLVRLLPPLLTNRSRLAQMSAAARAALPRDGAEKLARFVLGVADRGVADHGPADPTGGGA